MSLDHAVEESMRRWLKDHPRHRHGTHGYDLQHFGLPADGVAPAFAAHLQRFAALVVR